jgi:hypothetical protein
MLKKQSQLLRRGGKISKKLSPNNKSLPDHHFKKVKVKRGLSGLGLFAGEDIKKGELIIEYIGEILTKEEADKVTNCQYLFEVSRNHTINGSPRWNIARYANHSCDGNAESDVKKKRVFVSAKSACDSDNEEESHVIRAMYKTNNASQMGSLRISFGRETTRNQLNELLKTLHEVVHIAKEMK